MEKVFCLNCNKEVNYIIKGEKLPAIIYENEIYYSGLTAYCKECGSILNVQKISFINEMLLDDEVRESHGIISYKELKEFILNSGYSMKELEDILGTNVCTIYGWLEGVIPPKYISDKIKEIKNETKLTLK